MWQIITMPTNCVCIIVYKFTLTKMVMVQNFEVKSDKCNIESVLKS
jgi:hypothetical protein